MRGTNPIIKMDFPDPDVIYHDGCYYMISTTMHFFPGGEILRSYDLINWEHFSFVFERLDSTPGQILEGNAHIYGKGMWAPTLRFYEGTFYVAFSCNDMNRTFLYRSSSLEGPWKRSVIEGFYHDLSLYLEGGRAFVVYGNTKIHITELKSDLSGPLEGSDRIIVDDTGNPRLGFEGSHLYKIDGRYYLFMIHSLRDRWRRVQACFVSDSLDGEFRGGDVYDDDLGLGDAGVAQGGVVRSPDGSWNAVLFRDSGAVGRIPVVVPVKFTDDLPVFKGSVDLDLPSLRPDHEYMPLYGDDDFEGGSDKRLYGCFGLKSFWQFSHEPDLSLISFGDGLRITTDKISPNIAHARNVLTQRTLYPKCSAEVTIDGSSLQDGDSAGLCAFQGDFAQVGIERSEGRYYAVMRSNVSEGGIWDLSDSQGEVAERYEISSSSLTVRLTCDLTDDTARCHVIDSGAAKSIGKRHKLSFRLDHFTGVRFGLFVMSTEKIGGSAVFRHFKYLTE